MSIKIRLIFQCVASICAFAFTAAPAVAHEFEIKQIKGTTQGKNVGNYVFETGSGTVECTEEKSLGRMQVKTSPSIKETIEYGGCKAFGAGATVSQAKYEFKAEGTVTLENEVTVKVPSLSCEVKIPTTGNKERKGITYTNSQGQIELKSKIEGIASEGSGLCGGKNTTGVFIGVTRYEYYRCTLMALPATFKYIDGECILLSNPVNTGRWELIREVIIVTTP